MKILYVDDHVRFRTGTIRELLAAHKVTAAATLAEARALLAAGGFDVVLLDYDLPDGKGEELLAEIAGSVRVAPVIGFSSREENNARLLAAGAWAATGKMQFRQLGDLLQRLEAELSLLADGGQNPSRGTTG
jgi:DNA-binding response OmpR family regulator